MRKSSTVLAAAALAATTMAVAASGPAARADTGPTAGGAVAALSGSATPYAAVNKAMGAVPAASRLTIQLWLRSRTAAAASYASAVSTPGSPLFGHYLTPAAYTNQFGPTAAEAASVESWLRSAGFSAVSADSGRDYVQATASAATIDAALKTRLRYYRPSASVNAGKYALRANDGPLSLPVAVDASVLGVTGLSNAAPVRTWAEPMVSAAPAAAAGKAVSFSCSSWYAQHYARHLPRQDGTTSSPTIVCGYSADQLRAAYGYNRRNIGKGVIIALVEVGLAPDMFKTLQDYAQANRIESPSASRYAELALGRGSACGDEFNVEEQMDVESSYDMAPLANQLVVGGDSCDDGFYGLQALFDADTAILNGVGGHPLAPITSNSWEGNDESEPVNLVSIEHAYLLRAAAEGVSMLFSSGDDSGVLTPSSDPYATAVGGTTLGIGLKDPRLFETGWSTGLDFDDSGSWAAQGEAYAAGGGPSLLWSQPGYQRGVVPNALATAPGSRPGRVRAVPDISADADPSTPMGVGLLSFSRKGAVNGYYQQPVGGTSLATPLVAGMLADAEQYQRPFGFLNGGLYRLAGTHAVNDALPVTSRTPSRYRGVACDEATCGALSYFTFDVQRWSLAGYTGQVTRTGYDTMTGIGSPNGQNFIYDLRAIFG